MSGSLGGGTHVYNLGHKSPPTKTSMRRFLCLLRPLEV